MDYILLFTVIIVFASILLCWWVVNRQRQRKWLKTAKITDVVQHELYDANMHIVLDEIKAHDEKHITQAVKSLQKEGVFNSRDMAELYLHYLQKTLCGYSVAQRRVINEIGTMAFNRTMIQLQEKIK